MRHGLAHSRRRGRQNVRRAVDIDRANTSHARLSGVADADVRARGVLDDGSRGRGAGPPRLTRATAGRGGYAQQLRESGHLREPAGVVRAGDRAARAAGRAGLDPAAWAGVTLDVVRVGQRGAFTAPNLRTMQVSQGGPIRS